MLAALVAARGPFFFVSCDPEALLARELGKSTVVRGRDGTVIATIAPDQENRPVRLDQMSPWLQKAIVAIEDRRFYEHEGIDYRGTAPRARREHRRGRRRPGGLDDHAAAGPGALPRQRAVVLAEADGGLPGGGARPRVVEGADPGRLPQPRPVREPRLRCRGRRAHVLLQAGREADARRGGAPRRAAAVALAARPVLEPRRRAGTARRRARRDGRDRRDHRGAGAGRCRGAGSGSPRRRPTAASATRTWPASSPRS